MFLTSTGGMNIPLYSLPLFLDKSLTLITYSFRNSPETFPPNQFDFVNSRDIAGGINANRWDAYLRDIFEVLRPSGWCQMVELDLEAQSDNGKLDDGKLLAPGFPAFCEYH